MLRWIINNHKETFFPFYHLVSNDDVPHVKHLYSVTSVRQFEQELDLLLKHYEPISVEDVCASIDNNKQYKKPTFHLTFDDGLRECSEIIAPILLRKGVPASFFINSAFVDNKDMLYRMKVSLLIEYGKLSVKEIECLKSYTIHDEIDIEKLAFEKGVSFQQFLKQKQPYMSSLEIKELANQGFHVGAHSHKHPYFSDISTKEQLKEARKSLKFVQNLVQSQLKTFAFPFNDLGVPNSFFEELAGEVDIFFATGGLKKDERNDVKRRLVLENQTNLRRYLYKQYGKYMLKNSIRYKHIHQR